MVTKELRKDFDDCQVNINDYIACGQAQHNKELKSNYNVEHQDQCGKKKSTSWLGVMKHIKKTPFIIKNLNNIW